jgi:hypothetical protein
MRSFDWSAAPRILCKISTTLSTYPQRFFVAGMTVKRTFSGRSDAPVHNRFRAGN